MKQLIAVLVLATTLLATPLTQGQTAAETPVWIDVRSAAEWRRGHLDQAHLIPWDGIEAGIAALELDKDQPIYLYCRSGGRADKAKMRLQAQGYTAVKNIGSLEAARELAAEL